MSSSELSLQASLYNEIAPSITLIQDTALFYLPVELFEKIISYIKPNEYGNFLLTCKVAFLTRPLYVRSSEEVVSAIIRCFGRFQEIPENLKTEIISTPRCIQVLKLANSTTTPKDLAALTRAFPYITRIDLQGCSYITNLGLEQLTQFKNLQTLTLTFCYQITDEGLDHIANCTSLKNLDLYGCTEITDNGLTKFSSLSHLQRLSIRACLFITDISLNVLKEIQSLQYLNISHCYKITDNGRQTLKNALPNLQIGVG